MFVFKTQPQPISAVMSDGFNLFRESFVKVWYWAVLIMLPSSVLSGLSGIDSNANMSPSLILLLVVSTFFSLFLSVFCMGLISVRIHAVATQGDTRIKTAASLAIRKVLPIIAAAILAYIALLIIPALSALFLLVNTTLGITVLVIMSVIFFLFAPFYFYIFPFFILFEDKGVMGSLKASVQHMQGNIWRTIFMYIVLYLIGALVFIVIALLAMLLGYITPMGSGFAVAARVLPLLAIGCLLPLTISMFMVLFYDVKERKEAKSKFS